MTKTIFPNNEQEVSAELAGDPVISIPNVGLGISRSTTSYILLLLNLEGDRRRQIDILLSVLQNAGISPAELAHQEKQPDVMFERAYRDWKEQGEQIRHNVTSPCLHDWEDDVGGGFTYLRYCRNCFQTKRIDEEHDRSETST
jgi:hypothetical protein